MLCEPIVASASRTAIPCKGGKEQSGAEPRGESFASHDGDRHEHVLFDVRRHVDWVVC
jgi:hypothetical protein